MNRAYFANCFERKLTFEKKMKNHFYKNFEVNSGKFQEKFQFLAHFLQTGSSIAQNDWSFGCQLKPFKQRRWKAQI